jgi:hypothetical protein
VKATLLDRRAGRGGQLRLGGGVLGGDAAGQKEAHNNSDAHHDTPFTPRSPRSNPEANQARRRPARTWCGQFTVEEDNSAKFGLQSNTTPISILADPAAFDIFPCPPDFRSVLPVDWSINGPRAFFQTVWR